MLKMYGASGLVIIEWFFYLFLVRFTLASTKVKFCDFFVMLVMETDLVLTYLDGISVHCALVLIKVLYFCGFDVLG